MVDSKITEKLSQLADESEAIIKDEQEKARSTVEGNLRGQEQENPKVVELVKRDRSLKKIKHNTPPTRMELEQKIEQMEKRVQLSEHKATETAKVLVEHFSHLKGITSYGLSRLEAALDVLERAGILQDEVYDTSFRRVVRYQENMMRILGLPPKERIEEVKKWNEDTDHKRIKMESVGVIEYLVKNPDKLPLEERVKMATKAELSTDVIQLIESSENVTVVGEKEEDGKRL